MRGQGSELGSMTSCGGGEEQWWRTWLHLDRGDSFDDHHRAAALGAVAEWAGLLRSRCWLHLRLLKRAQYLQA